MQDTPTCHGFAIIFFAVKLRNEIRGDNTTTLVREGNISNTPLKEFIGKSTETKPAEVISNG